MDIRWELSRRSGFAAYQGDPVPQLRQGPTQMSSVINFVGSQFSVQVRPLAPEEMSPTCPIAVQPCAADNAEPLGLWVESPNWQLMADQAIPVLPNDPAVLAVVQLVTTSGGVQPAPPAQRGSAVMVDLIGDGVPDLVVSASYSDDAMYYRLVAVAPDGNPDAASAVMLEAGPTFAADGSRDPQSRGELRVEGVVEMNGAAPFELFVRRTTSNTTGVSIRDLTGAELAAFTCPPAMEMSAGSHRGARPAGTRSRSRRRRRRSTRSPRSPLHGPRVRRWRRQPTDRRT